MSSPSLPTPQSPLSDYTVFDYTAFNARTETVKDLSINYPLFSVRIDYNVAFNATTSADRELKAIIKMRNATSIPLYGLDIALNKTDHIYVNYVNGSDSDSTIEGGCPYYAGMIIQVLYDGTKWTVRDYNNASNVFASVASSNFTLRAIEASGENDSTTAGYAEVATDIETLQAVPISAKGASFLVNYTYNSTQELCSEVYGNSGNSLNYTGQVFWICSDNLLAYFALKQYDENVSNTIGGKLKNYTKTYSLTNDSSGLPISYKHEPILGDVLPLGMPLNPGNNTNGPFHYYELENGSSYVLVTEVNNETPWTTWVSYADELAWQGMSYINQNKTAEALAFYNSMMSLWDGYGFADAAYSNSSVPQYGHYEAYKLALAIILRQRLGLPKPMQEYEMDDILLVCQQPDGGIATGYDRHLSTTGHVENTETTALVVIANVTKLPVAPTISVLSPQDKTYNIKKIPLTFAVNEVTSWVGYSLDETQNFTVAGNTTLPALNDGLHRIVVYANDTAGNMGSSDAAYFTIDTTPPNISNVIQTPLKDNVTWQDEVGVNATVTDALSGVEKVTMAYAYANSSGTWIEFVKMTGTEGNVWNATIPPLPFGTNVTYTITAEDNADNSITTREIGYPVISEFPSLIILCLFTITTLITAIGYRKKRFRTFINRLRYGA